MIVSCHGDSFCLGVISRKGVNLKFSNRIGKMMPKPLEFFEGPTIFMRILQPQTEFKSRNHLLNIVFFSFSSSFFPFFCLVLVFFPFSKIILDISPNFGDHFLTTSYYSSAYRCSGCSPSGSHFAPNTRSPTSTVWWKGPWKRTALL